MGPARKLLMSAAVSLGALAIFTLYLAYSVEGVSLSIHTAARSSAPDMLSYVAAVVRMPYTRFHVDLNELYDIELAVIYFEGSARTLEGDGVVSCGGLCVGVIQVFFRGSQPSWEPVAVLEAYTEHLRFLLAYVVAPLTLVVTVMAWVMRGEGLRGRG